MSDCHWLTTENGIITNHCESSLLMGRDTDDSHWLDLESQHISTLDTTYSKFIKGKDKTQEVSNLSSREGEYVCTYISADTVDCGFVWMKGNTFMVFEEWGPTPATLGSCYPLLFLYSWGDFNEYSCSCRLVAPVRLSTGLAPLLLDWIFLCRKSSPSYSKEESQGGDRQQARWSNWIIDVKSSLGETSSRVWLNRLTTALVFAPVQMSKEEIAL